MNAVQTPAAPRRSVAVALAPAPARDPDATVSLRLGELQAMLDEAAERGATRALEGLTNAQPDPGLDAALLTPQQLADKLGVSRAFVYEHAAQLGGFKLGPSPKAPLRFDRETALASYPSLRSQRVSPSVRGTSRAVAGRRSASLAPRRPKPDEVLPARPREPVR